MPCFAPSEGEPDRHYSWTPEQRSAVIPGVMLRFGDGDYLWVLGLPNRTAGRLPAWLVSGLWIPAAEMDPEAITERCEEEASEYDLEYLDPASLEMQS